MLLWEVVCWSASWNRAPVTSWFISTLFRDFSSSQIVEDSSCKKLDPARYHWPPPPGSPYSGYACKPSLHGSGQIVAPFEISFGDGIEGFQGLGSWGFDPNSTSLEVVIVYNSTGSWFSLSLSGKRGNLHLADVDLISFFFGWGWKHRMLSHIHTWKR